MYLLSFVGTSTMLIVLMINCFYITFKRHIFTFLKQFFKINYLNQKFVSHLIVIIINMPGKYIWSWFKTTTLLKNPLQCDFVFFEQYQTNKKTKIPCLFNKLHIKIKVIFQSDKKNTFFCTAIKNKYYFK